MLGAPGRALCLCPRQRGQSRDGRPPAVLLARRRRAVGGQICLAWTAICESPVTGPTCQIKPTPVWRGRAAGIWKSPLSDPCHQLSEPLTSALWELPLHLVHSMQQGPRISARRCSSRSYGEKEKASLFWRLALGGLNHLLNSENLFFNGYSFSA